MANTLATSTISITPNSGENPKTSCEAPEVLLVVGELVAVLVAVWTATVFVGAVPPAGVVAAPLAVNPSEEQPTRADDRSAATVALTVA